MGFFSDLFGGDKPQLQRVRALGKLKGLGEMPELPSLQYMSTGDIPRFSPLVNVANILAGTELVRDKKGNYTYKKMKETPEQQKMREEILEEFNLGMKNLMQANRMYEEKYGVQNDLFKAINSSFTGLADGIQKAFAQNNPTDIVGANFDANLEKIKNYWEGKITGQADQAMRELDDDLGAEGQRNSLGAVAKAHLTREKIRDIADNEIYWMTEGKQKLLNLEAQKLQMQNMALQNQGVALQNQFAPAFASQQLAVTQQQMEAGRLNPYMNLRQLQNQEMLGLTNVGATASQIENQNALNTFNSKMAINSQNNALDQWKHDQQANWQIAQTEQENMNTINAFNADMQRTMANNGIAQHQYKIDHPWRTAFSQGLGNLVGSLVNYGIQRGRNSYAPQPRFGIDYGNNWRKLSSYSW